MRHDMRNFTCVQDLGNLKQALAEAFEIKKDRYQFTGLGKNKTLLMISTPASVPASPLRRLP